MLPRILLILLATVAASVSAQTAAPFGIQLGARFDSDSRPERVDGMIERQSLSRVPNRVPQFAHYAALVAEGSRCIVGVEAWRVYPSEGSHRRADDYAVIRYRMDAAYGPPEFAQLIGRERWIWRAGAMTATLELWREKDGALWSRLLFRVPR